MRAGTRWPPACCHPPAGAHRSSVSLRGHRQPAAGPEVARGAMVSPTVRRGTEGCTEQHPASSTSSEPSTAEPCALQGCGGTEVETLGVQWAEGDGKWQPSAGKGGRKRSRTREVAKWRALIYRRSLRSFPELERHPSAPALGARYGAGLGCAASSPACPVPACGSIKTPPPPERGETAERTGGARVTQGRGKTTE